MQPPKLHVARFEDEIDRRSRPVNWQEAIICSCWNPDSGSPDYACLACHGKGYVYQEPIEAKALVTSITLSKEYEPLAGIFEVGDAVMTVAKRTPVRNAMGIPTGQTTYNPLYDIGMHDRVTLVDDEVKSSEVLVKDMPINARPPNTLLNHEVTRVKSIQKYEPLTGQVVKYTPNVDFTFSDNEIIWVPSGTSPENGEQYSVVYHHRPIYVVTATLPKPRHQDGQDFPRYVALRYLVGGIDAL